MGGANGLLPHEFKRYTFDQIEAWWLRPMAAMRKATERAQGGKAVEAPAPGPMTMEQFRATFGDVYRDKPDDWWAGALAKWNREAASG
jgi:hypothetical protein